MRNSHAHAPECIEQKLRRNVPPLPAHREARVARICAALAALPPPAPHRRAHDVFQHVLPRAAAACLLAAATLCLVRFAAPPPAAPPSLPTLAFLSELERLPGPQQMTAALHAETDNLLLDFMALTAILNDRSLAILF
jgi:hypothetical protein